MFNQNLVLLQSAVECLDTCLDAVLLFVSNIPRWRYISVLDGSVFSVWTKIIVDLFLFSEKLNIDTYSLMFTPTLTNSYIYMKQLRPLYYCMGMVWFVVGLGVFWTESHNCPSPFGFFIGDFRTKHVTFITNTKRGYLLHSIAPNER